MASRVIIKKAGAKKGSRSQVLSFVRDLADRQLSAIANKSAEVMRQKVDESITRADSSGDLKESIYAVRIDSGHYGVGDISFMNVTTPYWDHVDKGSAVVGASYSHRVPVGGCNPGFTAPNKSNSDQRWFIAQGGWSFIPKKPIAPRNYIAKTITEQNRIIAEVLNTVR